MTNELQTINQSNVIINTGNNFSKTYFQKFIDDNRIKETTSKNYIKYLKHFILWIMEQGIQNPTRENIREYQKHLDSYISKVTGKKLEETTKQQYFQIVKTFFQFLENENLYSNITKGIKSFKIDKGERKRPFTEEEIKIIYNSIDTTTEKGKRDLSIFLLAVENGLRIIEIQRANIEDIETIDNVKRLYIQGKGKTEKNVFVNLSEELSNILDDYLKTRPKAKQGEALFVGTSNRSKGQRIERTSISRLFRRIFNSNGYNSKKLTFHSLRHTSGTTFYKITKDTYQVQKHQRHESLTSTEIYIHSYESNKDNSGQMIHNYIFKNKQSNEIKETQTMIELLNQEELSKVKDFILNLKGSDIPS